MLVWLDDCVRCFFRYLPTCINRREGALTDSSVIENYQQTGVINPLDFETSVCVFPL